MIDLDALDAQAKATLRRREYAGADDPYGQHVAVDPADLAALVRAARAVANFKVCGVELADLDELEAAATPFLP